ncbi:MAG: hypothetical protein CFE21_02585 [Bacteroidetes bacterium B1(2017)]|nr:MAG: hypothetical protein CFE21_02585 [Bacteroidetes bacterium B1(2017)]
MNQARSVADLRYMKEEKIRKVIIVDDDEVDRKILERWCKKEDLQFSSCSNGKEAFDALKKDHFDLLISDLDMPIMGGISLIQEIKKLHLHIPSIAISANENSAVKKAALESGFDCFIPKQTDFRDLSNLISKEIVQHHFFSHKFK